MNLGAARFSQWLGGAVALLGVAVLVGWAFGLPALKSIVHGLATMKANTALGFALGGAALACLASGRARLAAPGVACGCVALLLGALTLAERAGGFDLGIDQLLFDDPATPKASFPGRMSLATSLGFVVAGAGLLALWGASLPAAAAVASGLGLGLAVLGAIALAGYAIRLDILYAWPAFGTVAAHAAAGFLALGIGIALSGRARMPVLTEDQRITGLAASLLALAAAGTGLAAYSTMESAVERSLAEGVTLALESRIGEIRNTIELRSVRVEVITTRPNMLRNARLHAEQPANREYRDTVRGVVESFMSHGFSGVAVLDRAGDAYASSGRFVESAALELPLGAGTGASLLWKGGFHLRNRLPLRDARGALGEVLAEQPLANVDRALRALQAIGETAELLLCKTTMKTVTCFPSRLSPAAPFSVSAADPLGRDRLVIHAALTGEGFGTATDYRGRRVLGSFAPVGATGLVAVLKVDAEEIYAPLAAQFQLALFLIAAFTVGGALIVRSKVRPLAGALQDLYDNAPCGYHSVDADGRFVRMNTTWLSWLGYRREEVVGKLRHPDIMTPESAELFRTKWFPLFRRQGWLKEVEFEYVRKDGSTFPGLISGSSIYDKDGRFVMSRSTVIDITERKRIEAELRALNAQLQAVNKELESFSYSVSHDLRAPLRAVDGYALMLAEDYAPKLDDEGRRLLGVVRASAAQMGRLIDDLLHFSQVGRRPLNAAPLDMRALAGEVAGELGAAFPRTRIEIGDLPPAFGDRALLKHVWMNLIGNALKYGARAQAPRIEVGARDDGAEAVYWVRDNGAGFDMRYKDKLFNVFQRLHREDEFEGTGVGLAIVQRVLARHGGRAWAEGAVGEGACFSFALPKGGPGNGKSGNGKP